MTEQLSQPLPFCLSCKSCLRGVTSGRCPECGRHFDPNDAATYYVPQTGQPIPSSLLGALIVGGCVMLTCFITPLAMNSNLWPIAGVFWAALLVPIASGAGALMGWLLKPPRWNDSIPAFVVLGVLLAFAVVMVIASL